jgi:multiple antibiotic resistance protein
MEEILTFAVTSFISIFFIVNPLGNAPVFLAITENESAMARTAMVRRAAITMVGILIIFALAGKLILDIFHLSLSAIRISGGIILFILALNMIQAERAKMKNRRDEEREAKDKPDVSIVPLAIPMLAGPGSITTILVLTGQHPTPLYLAIIIAAIVFSGLMTYVILTRATVLFNILGKTGINIFTRIMGLLLAGLAVQFIINGIAGALPEIISKLPKH